MWDKPYCTCEELTSGRCGWCQGIDKFVQRVADSMDKDIEEAVYTEYLEDEEFDEKG